MCDIEAVNVLVTEGPARVRELMELGAQFDTVDGTVALTREAAHSKARILHSADATGEAIRQALVRRCLQEPNIIVRENQFLIEIITTGEECQGALVLDNTRGSKALYLAKSTIVATGGGGQLFKYTTNPDIATADGVAACFRAGCELADMEFVQFHPTVLVTDTSQRFLISEAVRGEGAPFVEQQKRALHAPVPSSGRTGSRDVVARYLERDEPDRM